MGYKIWIMTNNYLIEDIFPEEKGIIGYMSRCYSVHPDLLSVDQEFVYTNALDGNLIIASLFEIDDKYTKYCVFNDYTSSGENGHPQSKLSVFGFNTYPELQQIKHEIGMGQIRFKRSETAPFCEKFYVGKTENGLVELLTASCGYLAPTQIVR